MNTVAQVLLFPILIGVIVIPMVLWSFPLVWALLPLAAVSKVLPYLKAK